MFPISNPTIVGALGALSLAAALTAQNPGPGLVWTSDQGAYAGDITPVAPCTTDAVTFTGGEVFELTVWGDFNRPFVLAAAFGTAPCIVFPEHLGGLVLAPPLLLVSAGLLLEVSPCLSCPPAFERLTVPVPVGFPAGISIAFQALAEGAGTSSFTAAIVATSV